MNVSGLLGHSACFPGEKKNAASRLQTIDKRDIYRHTRLWGLCEHSENQEKTTDALLRYFVGICLVNLRLL